MRNRVLFYCCLAVLTVALGAAALAIAGGNVSHVKTAAGLTSHPNLTGNVITHNASSVRTPAEHPVTPYLKDHHAARQPMDVATPVDAPDAGTLGARSPHRTEFSAADLRTVSSEVTETTLGGDNGHGDHHSLDAWCRINNFAGSSVSYSQGWGAGDAFAVWYNPVLCGANPYPFRVDTVWLAFQVSAIDTFIFSIDIMCPKVPGDSCSGPGYSIWTSTYQIVFSGTGGRAIALPLPTATRPVVNSGFFVVMTNVYWGGLTTQYWPSVRWGNTPDALNCRQYYWDGYCGLSWSSIWGTGSSGNIQWYVAGNTNDTGTPISCTSHTCTVTCQGGDTQELTEPATPDSTNMSHDPDGGCNATPVGFGTMTNNQWVCGKFFTYTNPSGSYSRDTDWYSFTLTQADTVRLTVISESAALIGIVDTNQCVNPVFLASTVTSTCTTAITTTCLPAGQYAVYVSSASFYCPLSPSFSRYRAKINAGPCPTSCTPDFTMTAPGSWTSTTCGANDDCALRPGLDRLIQVNIPTNGNYQFSLCGGTNWDSYMYVTDACCGGNIIAEADEGCPSGNLSQTDCLTLTAGTYYVDIEPWETTQTPNCGPFTLNVTTCTPCLPRPANDDCANAIPITVNSPTATCASNNCATQDCNQTSFHEVWYTFTLPDACQNVRIRYCGTTISGQLGVTIFSGSCCGTPVGYDSYEYDSCPDGFITIHYDSLAAGTYYLPVNFSTYGNYCVRVTSSPCAPCVICPPGAVQENEPLCGPGYVDNTDGGCNAATPRWITLNCGQSVCGTSGTYNADTLRDTDWYRFVLTTRSYVTWSVVANFLPSILILDSTDCATSVVMAEDTSNTCDTARAVTALLTPGEYWAFVAPNFNGGHVDCGSTYVGTLTCTPCAGISALPEDISECAETPGPTFGSTDCDGGCNNGTSPHNYGSISCGQTIYGTSFSYDDGTGNSSRDTDWYHFTLNSPQRLTITAETDFPAHVFVLRYEDCTTYQTFQSFAVRTPCSPVTNVSDSVLSAGEYTLWIGPEEFFGVQYPSHYRLTLGCPCVNARQVTNYLNITANHVQVRWVAAVNGDYRVYSTTDRNIDFSPATWTLETTTTVPSGPALWEDPAAPVQYKRYVVVQNCP